MRSKVSRCRKAGEVRLQPATKHQQTTETLLQIAGHLKPTWDSYRGCHAQWGRLRTWHSHSNRPSQGPAGRRHLPSPLLQNRWFHSDTRARESEVYDFTDLHGHHGYWARRGETNLNRQIQRRGLVLVCYQHSVLNRSAKLSADLD